MPHVDRSPRSVAGAILLWLSVVGLLLGAFAAAGGSFGFALGPLRVSLRNPTNPLIAAVLCGLLARGLLGVESCARRLQVIGRWVSSASAWLALCLAVAVLAVTISRGAFIAGGADASGYLNEARLWRQGNLNLEVRVPLAGQLSLENGLYPWAPLGFRPSGDRVSLVPTYPPGLPIAMSFAHRMAGEQAQFYVVPLSAAGLVLVAFAFGRRMAGSEIALLGATATACSPTLLFPALQPMSDVPAAFCWMLAMLLVTWPTPTAALAAGAAAAMAGLIRPNLFALIPALAVCRLLWEGTRKERVAQTVLFVLPAIPTALLFLDWERSLYGSATQTGHGGITSLFSLSSVLPNVARYGGWLVELHTPVVVLAFIAPLLIARGYARPTLTAATAALIAWSSLFIFLNLAAFYSLYFVFDTWPYLRFFLPALPAILTLSFVPIAAASARLAGRAAGVVLLVLLVLVPTRQISTAVRLDVFRLPLSERRFADAAQLVSNLPRDAVLLSMFHSGSIYYYTGRPVLRWDWVGPDELAPTVNRLESAGHPVFAILDDAEESQFRSRFAASPVLGRLRRATTVKTITLAVSIYELAPATDASPLRP